MSKPMNPMLKALVGCERVLDQEWAACVESIRGSDIRWLIFFRELYRADDPKPMIAALRDDPMFADFTQRLAMLAMDEGIRRMMASDYESAPSLPPTTGERDE